MVRLKPPSPPVWIIRYSPSPHRKRSVMIRLRPKPCSVPLRARYDTSCAFHHQFMALWATTLSSSEVSTCWPSPVRCRARRALRMPIEARNAVP